MDAAARTSMGVVVALGLLVALGGPARAEDHGAGVLDDSLDYDTASDRWNGMGTLAALAKGLGLTVEAMPDIEWTELGADDILLVVYPHERLEPGHLAAFIRNGGNVLLADDFGDSAETMARLGMLRERAGGVKAERFYRDLPFAPVARPHVPAHPLAAGVSEIVTNHPAVLVQVQGAELVFGFGPGEGVIAAGALGSGRFVVSSDPSIFINRMLQFDGNMQLTVNALRYLSRDGAAHRLVILTGSFSIYGEPEGLLDDGTVRGTMASMLGDINRWLDERNDYLLTSIGMRAVALLVAALIAVLAILALPLGRRARLDGAWTRATSAPVIPPEDFDTILGRYDRAGPGGNFLLPATIVRDAVNGSLARILGERDPLHALPEQALYERLTRARGTVAAAALRRIYKQLKSLPSRAQAASLWSTGYLGRRDFERLHEDALELYLALGEEPR